MTRLAALGLALIAVVPLAACTPTVPEPEPTRVASPTRTPTPRPTESAATADVPVAIPDGVVATGDLRLATGGSAGTVTVTRAGALYTLTLPDREWGAGVRMFAAASDTAVALDQCGADNVYQHAFGGPELPLWRFPDTGTADPSYWRTILVLDYRTGADGGCFLPILAVADLAWTTPATRPWLAPADGGAATGARGPVLDRDGRPFVYRVVPGDAWRDIAARFGITVDDLRFLNPMVADSTLKPYSLLNLDPANRGNSAARAPGSQLSNDFEG